MAFIPRGVSLAPSPIFPSSTRTSHFPSHPHTPIFYPIHYIILNTDPFKKIKWKACVALVIVANAVYIGVEIVMSIALYRGGICESTDT